MELEQNTLLDIFPEEKNPDAVILIEGLILLLRLGTEGAKKPDAFAIYSTKSLYQENQNIYSSERKMNDLYLQLIDEIAGTTRQLYIDA